MVTHGLVGALLCVTAPAFAQEQLEAPTEKALFVAGEPAPDLRFGAVSASGKGCKTGTYSVLFQQALDGTIDERIFTIYFLGYRAEITPADDYADSACTMIVPVRVTHGWQYAVTGFLYHGRTSLSQGMTADIEASYNYLGDSALELARKSSLTGPLDEERFEILDIIPQAKLTNEKWSPCGGERAFVVTTSMTLANGPKRGLGYIRMTDVTASPTTERDATTRTRVANGDFVPGALDQRAPPAASFRLGLRKCE